MSAVWQLPLVRLFDFYLALMLFASTYRRVQQYLAIVKLAYAGPSRWPRLVALIGRHRTIFCTWATVAPLALTLALWLVQLLASRFLWPDAAVPPRRLDLDFLWQRWPTLLYLVPLGSAMVAFDLWGVISVGVVDRVALEKQFDQAEFWLRSPVAHVVRVATFGFFNPRKMVDEQVRHALVQISQLLHYNLWWLATQTMLRLGFGIALWLTWALL
ncbi:MAG: hypothetical protein NZO58_04910 [Gemmataceae bacterium]|nr:hypothetical protein [Gemmataceae bacterium]